MIKLVIFDLDGTILDTIPDIAFNLNAMLYKYGYKRLSEKQVAKIVGSGAEKLVKDAIGKPVSAEELKERLDFYNFIYTSSGSPKTSMFFGMGELFSALKNRGLKIAVLTNKPQQTTDVVNEKYLKKYSFDYVLGQREGIKTKPDKQGAMLIMNELGVLPEETVLVGDGETDAMTAINAGVTGVSCLWGYRKKKDLEKVGAVNFIKKPKDLLKFLADK